MAPPMTIIHEREVIACASGTTFDIHITAKEKCFVKNIEITNAIFIETSDQMMQLLELKKEISTLREKNAKLAQNIADIKKE